MWANYSKEKLLEVKCQVKGQLIFPQRSYTNYFIPK